MAFENLSDKLNNVFKKLRGKGRLSESDVKEAMREVRLALLEADVSYKVVKDFAKSVSERAVGTDVLESLSPAQMVIKIVNEELCALMGGQSQKLNIGSKSPSVVMLVGLQGAGKTTNGAKLAALMRKSQNKRPLLVACDVYRPAAIDQLKTVGKKLDLPVYEEGQGDPVEIAKHAIPPPRKRSRIPRYRRTAPHRRGAHGRAAPHQGRDRTGGDPACRGRDDRPGRRERRRRL